MIVDYIEIKLGLNTTSLKLSQFSEIPKPQGPQALPCSSTCQKCGNSSSKPLRRSNLPRSALDSWCSWAMGPKNGKLVVGCCWYTYPSEKYELVRLDHHPNYWRKWQIPWFQSPPTRKAESVDSQSEFPTGELGELPIRRDRQSQASSSERSSSVTFLAGRASHRDEKRPDAAVGKFEHQLGSLWFPMVPWEVLPSITILELGMASSPMYFKPV